MHAIVCHQHGGPEVMQYEQIADWLQQGRLRLHIGKTYPLREAARAHRDLEGRRTTGKLVLLP